MRFTVLADMKHETHLFASELCERVTFKVLTPLKRTKKKKVLHHKIIYAILHAHV